MDCEGAAKIMKAGLVMGTVSASDASLLADKSEVSLRGLARQGCASVIEKKD
jgi:hypothetical protein